MRLSQLKALIAAVEAARVPENTDPDIRFWMPPEEATREAHADESSLFIDLDLHIEPQEVHEHRIISTVSDDMRVYARLGDFTFPVARAPFYSKN